MSIYMLATIRRDFKSIVGLRLYDTETKLVKDYPLQGVVSALNNSAIIENIGLDNSKENIVGLNGSLDRYVKIIQNVGVAGPSTVVIIKEYVNGDYLVVNGAGDTSRMTEDNLIRYGETEGIANGSICVNDKGTKFIRSISGEFEQEIVKDNAVIRKRLEAKINLAGNYNVKFEILGDGSVKYTDKTIQKARINEGIESLADRCFENCRELTEIILPNSIRNIGRLAFSNCVKLRVLKIPYGFERFNGDEFELSYIEKIYLPASVLKVGSALISAPNLKVVYYTNRNLRNEIKVRSNTKRELVAGWE